MTNNLAFRAMRFAMEWHKHQLRKYTGNPYIEHLAEVAGIAMTAADVENPELTVAVAWLHDVIEDCDVTEELLIREFGYLVAGSVMQLSDLETGKRETRKRLSRERLAKAPSFVQTIKVADLISNTKSIVQYDPRFAEVYLKEKSLLLDVLTKADPNLLKLAKRQVEDSVSRLQLTLEGLL